MAIKSYENSFGAWAFLIGVIFAVVIGVLSSFFSLDFVKSVSAEIYAILVIIGVVVGVSIRVTGKDSQTFLVAGAILVIVSRFGMESVVGSLIGLEIGDIVSTIFGAFIALFVPATIIVALKTVFSITRI